MLAFGGALEDLEDFAFDVLDDLVFIELSGEGAHLHGHVEAPLGGQGKGALLESVAALQESHGSSHHWSINLL